MHANTKAIKHHVETIHMTDDAFMGANDQIVRFGFGPSGSRIFRDFPRHAVDVEAYRRAIVEAPEDFAAACEVAVCEGSV
jgi:hypothetical protein